MVRLLGVFFAVACLARPDTLGERAREYLLELIRRDTTAPPGNETRAAEYLRDVARSFGIECELIGDDPARLNFVARLKGPGA